MLKQVRIIDKGQLFSMFKFRSMVDDAESRLPKLAAQHDGKEELFKMRAGPRDTVRADPAQVLAPWAARRLNVVGG